MSEEISLDSPESQRFRTTLDMLELGIQMYRQRMKREHPNADEGEIDALVRDWILFRPGDHPGRPSRRFG